MKYLFFLTLVLLARAEPVLYTVWPTGSMHPTFDENYYIFVEPQSFETLKAGDIILYRSNKVVVSGNQTCSIICHRIFRISSGGSALILWGDNNSEPDNQLVFKNDYVGKVVRWVKKEDFWKEKGQPVKFLIDGGEKE